MLYNKLTDFDFHDSVINDMKSVKGYPGLAGPPIIFNF